MTGGNKYERKTIDKFQLCFRRFVNYSGYIYVDRSIRICQLGQILALYIDHWRHAFFLRFFPEPKEFRAAYAGYDFIDYRYAFSVFKSHALALYGGIVADIYISARFGAFINVSLWTEGQRTLDTRQYPGNAGINILCPFLLLFPVLADRIDISRTLSDL